ncbi:hypothetical protein C4D60_Mb09t00280 [Musa balbisiana]|uniref:Uncharacterized protein n=1 Tax=Musa balbisiana TaxID=52838 RepID=A0A4S8ICY8_MUSBA|nr:hypothetical protein C4D60_Mb09t00280 [Musa balbisiana]
MRMGPFLLVHVHDKPGRRSSAFSYTRLETRKCSQLNYMETTYFSVNHELNVVCLWEARKGAK